MAAAAAIRDLRDRVVQVEPPGQNLRDGMLVVFFLLLAAQAVVAAGAPQRLALLGGADPSVGGLRPLAGAGLMLAGIALVAAAQLHLGASWRIGIEDAARPGTVTGGLYRFCRNPIFLAMLVVIAGYTLMLPTVPSLVLLAGAYLGIRLQIAAEERYLERAYGNSFRDYAGRAGRLLPVSGSCADGASDCRKAIRRVTPSACPRGLEDPHHLGVAAAFRVGQRGHALAVRDFRFAPALTSASSCRYALPPLPSTIDSIRAVQPRLLTWSSGAPAAIRTRTTSAWPRCAAAISAVPWYGW